MLSAVPRYQWLPMRICAGTISMYWLKPSRCQLRLMCLISELAMYWVST